MVNPWIKSGDPTEMAGARLWCHAIGKNGQLPYHADLKLFKNTELRFCSSERRLAFIKEYKFMVYFCTIYTCKSLIFKENIYSIYFLLKLFLEKSLLYNWITVI